jgi:hypothetical protein
MVSPTVFHNGDIRLSDYCTVRVTDWVKTEDALTVRSEFRKEKRLYLLDRLIIWLVTELPFGVALKQRYLDPWMSRGNMVVTRNYEASVNPRELFPTSWLFSTYVLQEYFVPASGFISFAKSLQAITKRHKAKILNVSIRHARRDDDSLLNWARHPDIFCFVLYSKHRTSKKARERVGLWTRQLVDSVLAAGGTYYLPYQLHPTKEQFSEAYPMVNELVRIKRELDPDNRFTSKFWDKYLPMAESKNKEGEVGP